MLIGSRGSGIYCSYMSHGRVVILFRWLCHIIQDMLVLDEAMKETIPISFLNNIIQTITSDITYMGYIRQTVEYIT